MSIRISRISWALCLMFVLGWALGLSGTGEATEMDGLESEVNSVKDSIIVAGIGSDAPGYDSYDSSRRLVTNFYSGEEVELIRDRGFEWYHVRAEDGREGWIEAKHILIPADPETNRQRLSLQALEEYVNSKGFGSPTNHFVWVDIDRQLTHVFVGQRGAWKLERTMPCSTGKNISPTLRGLHEIAERGEWFFTERLARGGRHWVQFSGPYLFHSLPMDREGNIMDYILLERRSSGCIRLSLEDSFWFYSFIKRKSPVFVN